MTSICVCDDELYRVLLCVGHHSGGHKMAETSVLLLAVHRDLSIRK